MAYLEGGGGPSWGGGVSGPIVFVDTLLCLVAFPSNLQHPSNLPAKSASTLRRPFFQPQAGVARGEGMEYITGLTRSLMPPLCEEGG